MSRFKLKRGATFEPQITVTQSVGGPLQPLTGWQIKSEVRTPWGEPVASLTVHDRNDAAATYKLRPPEEGTDAWPLGRLEWDIFYTRPDGKKLPTETIEFETVQQVTR